MAVSAATTSIVTTNASHYDGKGQRERWPVLVYRLQSHRGWEVYCDSDMEAQSSSSSSNKSSNAKRIQTEELTASPREGCIEVRKMRLRIRLYQQNTPWEKANGNDLQRQPDSQGGILATVHGKDDGATTVCDEKTTASKAKETSGLKEEDSDLVGADGWNNNAILVRRSNTLLVSTRRGMGAVVFKFKSEQECIEFCDRLVYLNQDYFYDTNEALSRDENAHKRRDVADMGYVNGMDQREIYLEGLRESKRRRLSMMQDQFSQTNNDRVTGEESELKMVEEIRNSRRKDAILSYIVRLAHDDEFRGFVDEIERGLMLEPGSMGVYSSLGH